MRAKVVSLAFDHCESVSVATTTWHGIIKLHALVDDHGHDACCSDNDATMHVNQIASRFVQLLFSMPPWQAAVHFRPALAHAHF